MVTASRVDPGTFYCSTEGRVYRSADDGVHWQELRVQWNSGTHTEHAIDMTIAEERSSGFGCADQRIPLAQMAVEETGMGVVEDKVIKNHFASEYIFNKYRDEKTCGGLSEDEEASSMTVAEPMGVICGIVATTNPTSTAIFKALIALKTRNGIVFSPHPRARRSTCEAAHRA